DDPSFFEILKTSIVRQPAAWRTFEKMKLFDRKDKGRDEDVSKTTTNNSKTKQYNYESNQKIY
ncbi:hypothetical protein, partial [Alistipes senegalensis]|uniref:hypothetical protein n=1 Tax=Alistipes senegalensis TaxID=1288121 RepID=UPI00242BA78F